MGPAGGRGRKSILPSSPRPSPSCGLKWGTRWAWLRWRLCPAGAPVERNPCPTPGASMSCTACAKVRLGLACLGRKGPMGWVGGLACGHAEMGAGKGDRSGLPASGRPRCRNGWSILLQNRKGGQFLQSAGCGAHGDGFLGSGLHSVLTPPLPPSHLQMSSQDRWRA